MPHVIATFRDNKGKETSRTVYFDDQLTYADNATLAAATANEMAALSDAELAKTEMVFTLQTSTVIPAGNINHAQVGAFGCRNEAGTLTRVTVPALIDAAVQPDSDLLDRDHAAVSAFITRLESGDIADYRDAELETVEYAREEHTRRG